MASVNNVSSATSSIYGKRNVISGLASGMDTESLIENAVSGIQQKISALQQKSTRVQWQQQAYRNIIDQILNFGSSYSSYASNKNLSSASFFNSASLITTAGKYADKVSATGKSTSNVQLLGVKQLATAATYSVSGVGGRQPEMPTITGGELDLAEKMNVSSISGSLTINYGGDRSYQINFGELEAYDDAHDLAAAISKKLGEQKMTLSDGSSVAVNSRIGVRANAGKIEFFDKAGAGNSVYISSASGDIRKTLNIKPSDETTSIEVGSKALYEETTRGEYLQEKPIRFTLDGVTKSISVGDYTTADGATDLDKLVNTLNDKLSEAFGKGKIKVSLNGEGDGLKFETGKGSIMSINGGTPIGLESNNESSYLDLGKTLGDILHESDWDSFSKIGAEGEVTFVEATKTTPAYYKDEKGNRVAKDDDGKWYRVDSEGAHLYEFKLNGKTIGAFSKNSALENVTVAINNNSEAGVNVSYSKITNQFKFTAEETGSAGRIDFGDGLAQKLFGKDYDKEVTSEDGVDAIFSMSVNGEVYDGISRGSNTFDVDGMSVSLKGTFGEYTDSQLTDLEAAKADAVTFTYSADSDKIVDAIKSFVEDYNAMVTEIKNAYSTMPATKSNKSRYEPLTEDDKAGMSESAIAAYEEKAKQGLLFADRDLANLYSKLTSIVSPGGQDGADLQAIGIDKSYNNGLTTLTLDENKLREALEANPDRVKDVFTKTMDNGASTNGLMASLKNTLDSYAKATGVDKGILVEKAGSAKVPTSIYNNSLQQTLDNYDKQIEKWQTKLSDRVDYYTKQFTILEQLIAEMNSQSSTLMGLMGTGTGA